MSELEMRRGIVSRWKIYPKPGERFGVLFLEKDVTPYAGGFVGGVERGDEIAMLAMLSEHPRFGAQYKVQKVVMHVPGKLNLVNWLLLRMPNIGPIRARLIKEQFEDSIWDVLESNPLALTCIDGITEERAQKIAQMYTQERETIAVFTDLLRLGVDPKILTALVKKNTPSWLLKNWLAEDPYQLAVQGLLKFQQADEIGTVREISKTDARRICGAVVTVLKERRRDGHTATAYNVLRMEARTVLGIKDNAVIDEGVAKAATLPFPAHFSFFGDFVQWTEHAEADLLFATALGVIEYV